MNELVADQPRHQRTTTDCPWPPSRASRSAPPTARFAALQPARHLARSPSPPPPTPAIVDQLSRPRPPTQRMRDTSLSRPSPTKVIASAIEAASGPGTRPQYVLLSGLPAREPTTSAGHRRLGSAPARSVPLRGRPLLVNISASQLRPQAAHPFSSGEGMAPRDQLRGQMRTFAAPCRPARSCWSCRLRTSMLEGALSRGYDKTAEGSSSPGRRRPASSLGRILFQKAWQLGVARMATTLDEQANQIRRWTIWPWDHVAQGNHQEFPARRVGGRARPMWPPATALGRLRRLRALLRPVRTCSCTEARGRAPPCIERALHS